MKEQIEKEILEKYGVEVNFDNINDLYKFKGYIMRLGHLDFFDSQLEKLEREEEMKKNSEKRTAVISELKDAREKISRGVVDSKTSKSSGVPLTREQLLKEMEAIRKKNGGLDQSEDYLNDYYDTSSMYNDEFHETVEEVEGRIR